MISQISNNANLFFPTTGKVNLNSAPQDFVADSQAIIDMLPQMQQQEMLLMLEQMLSEADAGSLNTEMLLKVISQYQSGITGSKGLFIDSKI